MPDPLKQESARLAESWRRHEAAWLRDYMVSGVEDPRRNLQSILSRHFLVQAIAGDRFAQLMREEYRFSAVTNWLGGLIDSGQSDAGMFQAIDHALCAQADNAEGIPLPGFLRRALAELPGKAESLLVPNYVQEFLTAAGQPGARAAAFAQVLPTFVGLWKTALQGFSDPPAVVSVLEPACGSANDYRFLDAYGLVPFLDYTGFDLCEKNIANARASFPKARFKTGNVFAIDAPDQAFEVCFFHDLLEHLSPAGLAQAVAEICRVTRSGICAGFFQMDEITEHRVRPMEQYYWNLLSVARMTELFARYGFETRVIHTGSFLRHHQGDAETHNANAYTFYLRRKIG